VEWFQGYIIILKKEMPFSEKAPEGSTGEWYK
jgi:hypothetical protein